MSARIPSGHGLVQNTQASTLGQELRHHAARGTHVHLWVRKQAKARGKTMPFVYCGELEFQSWEGEKPITVWWRLRNAVPERLWHELTSP